MVIVFCVLCYMLVDLLYSACARIVSCTLCAICIVKSAQLHHHVFHSSVVKLSIKNGHQTLVRVPSVISDPVTITFILLSSYFSSLAITRTNTCLLICLVYQRSCLRSL